MTNQPSSNISEENQASSSPEPTPVESSAKVAPAASSAEVSQEPPAQTPTTPKANKKWNLYLIVAAVAILLAIGGGVYWYLTSQSTNTPATEQSKLQLKGEIAIVEGVVEKQVDDDSWKAVKQGDTIISGDTIRTGPDSRVVVNLDDGSAVRLDQNSSLGFTKLSNTAITLTQISGRAYHRVQKGQLVYTVKSLNTTATALGTSFSTSTDSATSTSQVIVLESKVKVATEHVNDDTQVDAGSFAVVDNAKHEVKVNTIDPKTLEEDFYQWNTALNEGKTYVKPTPTPTPTPEPTQANTTQAVKGLTLSVTPIAGGVKLSWVMTGQTAPKGFKVIKAKHSNPTFGQDHAEYISDPSARSYSWTGFDSQQYYFRVGIYNGEGISWYSNIVAATPLAAEPKETSAPFTGSINLTYEVKGDGIVFDWTATNADTVHGWKLVYSSDANPTYPEDNPVFIDAGARTYTRGLLPSGSTYHFRLGAWINGAVASNAYSNDLVVTMP